jgi:hypothetical protein
MNDIATVLARYLNRFSLKVIPIVVATQKHRKQKAAAV